MSEDSKPQPKIGAGHFQAMARLGLNELRNLAYAESTVAQKYPESGLYGTVTPAEVGQQRQADTQPVPQRDAPDIER